MRLSVAGLLGLLAIPAPAPALDRFEIQVYQPDINAPGELGLELHTNFTVRGDREPAFPGEIPPHHAFRMTLEPALGVTSWLELGAYLQGLTAPGEGVRFGGAKLRAKLVAPHQETGFFIGLNVEVGRVPGAVEQAGWSNELRPFLGWTDGTWLLDLNPIVGYALTGADRFRADLEPAGKVSWNSQRGFALGLEWYAELGFADALLAPRDQSHWLFAVVDLAEAAGREKGPWELNLAVGGALTGAADQRVIVKAIVGRSF